jgi:histidine triad (HIT) family protein
MPSVFTRIIDRELPGRFVYEDEQAVAFLTIAPIRTGHTLVVPREEIDHWLDLPPGLASHLFTVSRTVGAAIDRAFRPTRVGLMIAGLEVPHVHVHLLPIDELADLDFARAQQDPDPAELDSAAAAIRAALG